MAKAKKKRPAAKKKAPARKAPATKSRGPSAAELHALDESWTKLLAAAVEHKGANGGARPKAKAKKK